MTVYNPAEASSVRVSTGNWYSSEEVHLSGQMCSKCIP